MINCSKGKVFHQKWTAWSASAYVPRIQMWGKEFFVLNFIFAHTHKRGTSPKKRLVELHRHAPGQWLQCNRRQRVNAEGVTATTTTMTLDGKCQTRDELKLWAGSTLVVLELVASQSSRQDSQTAARRVVGAFHVLLWAFASCPLPLAFCLLSFMSRQQQEYEVRPVFFF